MPDPAPTEIQVLSVWELTRSIRSLLESEVGSVWVEGEISNHRKQASGHQYFTLKDERSQLPCVLFRGNNSLLSGPALADGLHVQLYGELTVYELRGQYQMVVQMVQGKGVGALQARFEALKARLAAEGLFDPVRKKPLPAFPMSVGLVTSPTGAALQDMLNILKRRAPWLRIVIHPVRVQGQGASVEIAAAVADFNRRAGADANRTTTRQTSVDLIVVARGGGSIEDLFEFNEEIVARAIAASDLPVVSAIGHEIDFTIADFVADLRAPTPSAAAELIVPDTADLLRQLAGVSQYLDRQLEQFIERARERLQATVRVSLLKEPLRRLLEARQQLDSVQEALTHLAENRLRDLRSELNAKECCLRLHGPEHLLELRRQSITGWHERLRTNLTCAQSAARARLRESQRLLTVLGPQATLERGYTIVMDEQGNILRQAQKAVVSQRLTLLFADGKAEAMVDAIS